MIVTEIELQNFKTIDNFKQEFTGGIYLVTGENEVGKSTLINAIATLLTGNRSDNLLKQGEEKGFARMTVGDYDVEIKFTDKNPRGTFTIRTKEGMKSNNISMLQQVFEYQDFDAHDFVTWSKTAEGRRKQVEAVKSLLPKETIEKLSALDSSIAEAKERRKDENALVRNIEPIVNAFTLTEEEVVKYSEPLDVAELIKQRDESHNKNLTINSVKQRIGERNEVIESNRVELKENLDSLDAEIKRLQELKTKTQKQFGDKIEVLESKNKEAAKYLEENKVIDLTEIDAKLKTANEHNQNHNAVKAYKAKKQELEQKQAKVTELNGIIANYEEEKSNLIASSQIPVDGLTFTDDGLFLNGVPFAPDEVSTSQEMEVAAKLIIAKNPKTKVFRIAQGESLGAARLESIIKFAEANGYQGFIEEVHRGQEQLIVEKYTEK